MRASTFGGRIQDRLNGSLHDTLMLELMREAQPLPDSVERGRVRALHHSQVFQLIRDVLSRTSSAPGSPNSTA